MQVLIALRYYASGSFLQVIGDTFGVDKTAASRVATGVSEVLWEKLGQFVQFPANTSSMKAGVFEMAGFPGVIGCVDGSHIRIIAPAEDEPDYVNRKGYHSTD